MLRCVYCNNNKDKLIVEDYNKDESIDIKINSIDKVLSAKSEFYMRDSYYYGEIETSIKIAYCPFCGRKL